MKNNTASAYNYDLYFSWYLCPQEGFGGPCRTVGPNTPVPHLGGYRNKVQSIKWY